MTIAALSNQRPIMKRRATLLVTGPVALLLLAAGVTAGMMGFRINLTPSEPLGLWRIAPIGRPVRNGDLVFICPPGTDAMRLARKRGYLRSGLCPEGIAPLIKTVVALAGQSVTVGEEVRIDGRRLDHSHVMRRDGKGRPLIAYRGGVVPADAVFLHSDFPGSFDSRYFGPLPVAGILGLAREVWTYAP
jgi:conjugative transfer signal peptidase TraF